MLIKSVRVAVAVLSLANVWRNAQEFVQFDRSYDINSHATLVDIFSPDAIKNAQVTIFASIYDILKSTLHFVF